VEKKNFRFEKNFYFKEKIKKSAKFERKNRKTSVFESTFWKSFPTFSEKCRDGFYCLALDMRLQPQ